MHEHAAVLHGIVGRKVDDEGYTRIDPAAPKLRVATGWSDFEGFHDRLVERLCA